jgi:hypothetical protein
MASRKIEDTAFEALSQWFDYEHEHQEGGSDRYIVCAGLAVLEVLKARFPIQECHYLTPRNQVRTSGPLIQKILKEHGEERRYSAEGGRTTRSTRPAAERLVQRLNGIKVLVTISDDERVELAHRMQGWLVESGVAPYFNRQHIEVEISLDKPGPQIIADIIAVASERNAAGCVAQHLVGAKLALRYPDREVENYASTTADVQLGRPGDFLVGDTVFHVTVAPMPGLMDKCEQNVRNGYRAILLVSESKLQAARQMAEARNLQSRLGTFPLEQFVGQNIEELAGFEKASLSTNIKALLEKYNERVGAVETDKSLLIKIPRNL